MVQDKELYQQIVGLVSPWRWPASSWITKPKRFAFKWNIYAGPSSGAPNLIASVPSMTSRANDAGDIWVPVSSRRS
jgi:hypothetical protein